MDNNATILTPDDHKKLLEELEWREGDKDREIVEQIREARGFGDLSENAEFEAAKEEQAQNAARIAEIRMILNNAVITEDTGKRKSIVSIGSTVEVEDAKGKKQTFTIVGTTGTNSLDGRTSNESPSGEALIGAKKGDTVEFALPNGKTRKVKILSVKVAKK